MWEDRNSDANGIAYSKHNDAIFNELIHECKHNAPGARLSARLRTALERMSPEERQAVVSRTHEGCAPLFVAARRGNVELVEYLVHVCGASLEQRGIFEVVHDQSRHAVTPLWGAAVAGRLRALSALAAAGADLNAASDSGSTPARSACFMTHLEVVRFLAENGADLKRANHNGGTCLINAVQSVPLCELLLERRVPVDAQDTQLKTALHYAIQEHRLETVRLLLEHGASPLVRSRAGDDALRTAALRGAAPVLALLVARVPYEPARIADAWELLGATQLDEFNDVSSALGAWRRATALRHSEPGGYIAKEGPEEPLDAALLTGELAAAATGGVPEWRTAAELEDLATDVDALRLQAILVAARVAGPSHKDTVFRLMYRGASYADSFRYQRCIELWTWALHIRIEKDTLLHPDSVHTASALTRLLLEARRLGAGARHAAAARVFGLLAGALPAARAAVGARPVHRRQADGVDRCLRCVAHLLLLQLQTARPRQLPALRQRLRQHLADDVRSTAGDTLLHLAASRLTVVRSAYFSDEAQSEFPSCPLVELLLECGADPCVRNEARSTALHVAAVPYNYDRALLRRLLAGGAHLDQPNRFGDSAAELVRLHRDAAVKPLQHITLACLAARALVRLPPQHQPPAGALPRTLYHFLDLHRP